MAPKLRDEPDGWDRSLTFAEVADWLGELARDASLSAWDRATCAMAAETFAREEGLADRVARARVAVDNASRGPMTAALLWRLSEATMLPLPFNPWEEPT